MTDQIQIFFRNSDSSEKLTIITVGSMYQADSVLAWYGSYYNGDDYTVTIDGALQDLDINGRIIERTIKDCPFCGGEAADWGHPKEGESLTYHCKDEACPGAEIISATFEKWNTRSSPYAIRINGNNPIDFTECTVTVTP